MPSLKCIINNKVKKPSNKPLGPSYEEVEQRHNMAEPDSEGIETSTTETTCGTGQKVRN